MRERLTKQAMGKNDSPTTMDVEIENPKADDVFIDVQRVENVPGTHSVLYTSEVDFIEIKHVAHNREGFALGSVIAAEWIIGKKGVFSMKDVLFQDNRL